MTRARREDGLTLIEVLVTTTLFSITAVGFYSVMFSTTEGSDTSVSLVRISEEARLGFHRMIRDTREGNAVLSASDTSYRVRVDFNGDGKYENPNSSGDYEDLTFSLSGDAILLNSEVLMRGVYPIGTQDLFSYSSNRLEFDWDGDGTTTWQELDEAPVHGIIGVGNNNGVLDSAELSFISSVSYALRVKSGNRTTDFYSEAQLRNRR